MLASRQHAKAAVGWAPWQRPPRHAVEGSGCDGGGVATPDKLGGGAVDPLEDSRWRKAGELCMVEGFRNAVRGSGNPPTKHGQFGQGGHLGIVSIDGVHQAAPAGGRVGGSTEGHPQRGGAAYDPQAVRGWGQVSWHLLNGQQYRLGLVEALASGVAKGGHGVEEGGDVGERRQEHLGVVCVLGRSERAPSHRQAGQAGLEVAQQCLLNEEVKEGGEGAALPHASGGGRWRGDVAIDDGPGAGAG